jgi:Kef-type K+ transport system membrane component KefB
MDNHFFAELSIVIAIGAIISLVMRIIRQPLIIGYIITGIVVGPTVLNIATNNETLEIFAEIGIALLLFIIGLGLNPKVIKEVGKVSGFVAAGSIGITALAGYLVSQAFDYSKTEGLVIGMALAFSSTIVILKLLSDKKEVTRLHGKIAIGTILIEDLVATIALIYVTARSEGAFSLSQLLSLGVKGIALMIPIYAISIFLLPKMQKLIAGSQEFLFLFAIGWGFGIATLFEYFGFSIEIGALFAGVALASLPYAQEMASRLRPLRDFFIVVFFIVLGIGLNFTGFSSELPIVIILSLIVILLKPLIVMVTMGIQGYTKNTSFKAGINLSQISEFSLVLVVLAYQQGLVRPELVTIITLVALITIAYSAYAITYSNQLYILLERRLVMFERKRKKVDRTKTVKYDMILFGYNRGGQEFIRVAKSMNKKYVVVDYDPEIAEILVEKDVPLVYGDATDPELLEELNLPYAKMIVSTVSDHQTNLFLAHYLEQINPSAVFICNAETAQQASELYEEGTSYVMMPHYIGSEKIGSFIKRNGYNKSEFRKFRENHLKYLETHYS